MKLLNGAYELFTWLITYFLLEAPDTDLNGVYELFETRDLSDQDSCNDDCVYIKEYVLHNHLRMCPFNKGHIIFIDIKQSGSRVLLQIFLVNSRNTNFRPASPPPELTQDGLKWEEIKKMPLSDPPGLCPAPQFF